MLDNIKIKNTTKCDCGREFIINDIQKLERINDKTFYSGVVKHYSKATCPNCGKEIVLLLKQVGQTYKVINIAEKIENISNNVGIETEHIEIETTIKNDKEKIQSDELICPVCKKECKSKSGMLAHMRTHGAN